MIQNLRHFLGLALLIVLPMAVFGCASDPAADHARNPSAPGMAAAEDRSPAETDHAQAPPDDTDGIVEFTDDPIEPFNRVSFVASDALMDWVIVPAAKGYSFVIRKPVRKSIRNFGENLAYPVRLINTLLQGKFRGARDETGRFVVNTTVGLLGLFDPAGKWGLEPFEEDFGQTFGKWGMGTGFYLFLPVTGPSSGRDAVGAVGDALANPATYVPGLSPFLRFNDLTFLVYDYERLSNSQSDPYFLLREFQSVDREKDVIDYAIPPEAYEGDPLPATAAMAYLEVQNPAFRRQVRVRSVKIPATGRKLPYSIWPRDDSRDLVFVLPGVGSHRDSGLSHAAAEMIYDAGFTPVTISSPFNWEFMNNAATAAVPGFTPFDVADIDRALSAIYADINQREHGHYDRVAVVGLSLGAMHALFLAAQDPEAFRLESPGGKGGDRRPPYSRFVAVSPPVDPLFALHRLDEFFRTPLRWPADERQARVEDTLYKAAVVADRGLGEDLRLPFTLEESQFLIGLGYRNILQNTIFASQRRHDLGVLTVPYRWSDREALYREIWAFGYEDYMERFVLPYVEATLKGKASRQDLVAAAGLRSLESRLKPDPRVRVIVNEDDFVMESGDRGWLEATFGSRLIPFEEGGHLGGLYREEAKHALGRLFEELPADEPHHPAPRGDEDVEENS